MPQPRTSMTVVGEPAIIVLPPTSAEPAKTGVGRDLIGAAGLRREGSLPWTTLNLPRSLASLIGPTIARPRLRSGARFAHPTSWTDHSRSGALWRQHTPAARAITSTAHAMPVAGCGPSRSADLRSAASQRATARRQSANRARRQLNDLVVRPTYSGITELGVAPVGRWCCELPVLVDALRVELVRRSVGRSMSIATLVPSIGRL